MASQHLGEDAGVEVGDDVARRRNGRIDEAVTLTARLRSKRRMDAKPRPGSTTATWLVQNAEGCVVVMSDDDQ